MMDLMKKIKACKGFGNCYGKVTKIKPFMFPLLLENIKVLVISEQPRKLGKKIYSNKTHLPYKLKMILGEEFVKSMDEGGIWYWTHFVKCYVEFRKLKTIKKKDRRICANTWLLRELEIFGPSVIISVGGECGAWIIEKFWDSLSYKVENWREHFYRQTAANEITKIKI